jgi:hypothetical protein
LRVGSRRRTDGEITVKRPRRRAAQPRTAAGLPGRPCVLWVALGEVGAHRRWNARSARPTAIIAYLGAPSRRHPRLRGDDRCVH